LLERLRDADLLGTFAVLTVSGAFPLGAEHRCRELGACDCMRKPWSLDGFQKVGNRAQQICEALIDPN